MNLIQKALQKVFGSTDPLPADAVLLDIGSPVKLRGGEKQGLYGVITAVTDTDVEITRFGVDGETIADQFLLDLQDIQHLEPN